MMAMVPEPDDAAEYRRLHPATLLLRAPQLARSLLNALPLLILLAAKGNVVWMLFGGLGIIAIGWVSILLYWTRFQYRIGADDIAITSGILSRNHRVIPFDRVQDVSIEQGVIARALGLAKVRLETGASAAAGQEEGELNAIALDEAAALRDQIRSWRAGHAAAVADEAAMADDPALRPPLFAMALPRVLTAGLFNFSLALFVALFGALQAFDDLLPFNPFDPRSWWKYAGGYLQEGDPWVAYLLSHRILTVLIGLAMLGLLGMASGIITTLLKQYGFRLERTATGFRRQRGLTTRTDVVIPLKRVQAAMVETGGLRRRFGWYALKLQSLASDGAKESDHDVAPLARLPEIDTILAATDQTRLLRTDARAEGWRGVHPAMWRRWAWLALPLALIVAALAWWPGFEHKQWLWALLPLSGWFLLGRYWRWSHHHYRLERIGNDPLKLEITHGWWKRRHLILPVRNIQSIDIDYGPLYRMAGLASVRFGVAGQGGLEPYTISALPLATAYALRARLMP